MERQLEASLRSVTDYLGAHGYRYAVIGDIALSQWGVALAVIVAP